MIITDTELNTMLFNVLDNEELYSTELQILAELQYTTGCRITEGLEFTRWTLLGNGNIQLQPQKSNNLRVFDPSITINKYFGGVINNVNTTNGLHYRKYNYYIEKIIGFNNFTIGNKGVSSHLFRHNFAKQLKVNGMSDNDIKNSLGEITQQSANHYIYSQIHYIN